MKKITFFLLFFPLLLMSQDYPKDAYSLLVGKELKILPGSEYVQKNGYFSFYKKKDLKTRLNAKHSDFNGQTVKLISVDSITSKYGENSRIIFELSNSNLGTVYYEYEPTIKETFIFEVVGGLKYPEKYWCKDIERIEDKFSGNLRYNSPREERLFFVKEKDRIYLYLKAPGSTLSIGKSGTIILLDDKTKIENNIEVIDVKVDKHGGYQYSVMIPLTPDQVEKLSTNYITDFRLFVYDFSVRNGTLFREYLKCMKNL